MGNWYLHSADITPERAEKSHTKPGKGRTAGVEKLFTPELLVK